MASHAPRKVLPSGLLFVLPPPPPPPRPRPRPAAASPAFPALKSFRSVSSGAGGMAGDCDDPLLSELRPIWFLLRVLGCAPLAWGGRGPRFRWVSWRVAYSVALWALLGAAGAWVAGGSLLQGIHGTFDEKLFAAMFVINALPHFALVPAHLVGASALAEFLRDWAVLQRAVERWCREPLRLRLKRWAWLLAVALPVAATGLVAVESSLVPAMTDVHVVFFYGYVGTLVHLHAALWWLVCWAMARTAHALAGRLAEEAAAGRGGEAEATHRALWLRLNAATRTLGTALAAPMLLLCSIWGTLVVIVAYGGLMGVVVGHSWRKNFGMCAYTFLCIGFLYIVCDAAYRTSTEVGEASARALLRVAAQAGAGAEHLSAEAGALLRDAALQPPSVSLAGFVTLDRGFLSGFLSSVVTYLIVLVQFREQ